MGRQPEPKPMTKPQDVVNVVFGLASVGAAVFTPALHWGQGTHAYRHTGIWALFLIVGYSAICPPVAYYIPIWVLLLLLRRGAASRDVHSMYQGYPWYLPFLSERMARILEPIVLFGIGTCLSSVSEELANFCLIGAVSLFIITGVELEVIKAHRRIGRDREIEMRNQMRWYRGDNW
jgi:hypothetical protein